MINSNPDVVNVVTVVFNPVAPVVSGMPPHILNNPSEYVNVV